jgi:hypothetical protein
MKFRIDSIELFKPNRIGLWVGVPEFIELTCLICDICKRENLRKSTQISGGSVTAISVNDSMCACCMRVCVQLK